MESNQYIERNPQVMLGKPIIKGTRITVEQIMRKLAEGETINELLNAYPHLNEKQIKAAIDFAADIIANEDSLEVK